MVFYWPRLISSFLSSSVFIFLLSSMGWYYRAGVFGLVGCKSLALLTNGLKNNTRLTRFLQHFRYYFAQRMR